MHLKFSIRQEIFFAAVMLLIIIFMASLLIVDNSGSVLFSDFLWSCKICTIAVISSYIIFLLTQKNIFTINNISYTFFIMFQFGVPIIYALDPTYYNFYTSLFDERILNNSVIYTTLCILFWGLGAVLFSSNLEEKKNIIIFSKFSVMKDSARIKKLLILVIVITGLITIPLYTYYGIITLQEGFSQEIRRALVSNALYRFGLAFFLPSCLLYRCYSKLRYFGILCSIDFLFLYICIISLVIGDRTTGICWLLVFFYDIYSSKRLSVNQYILDGSLLLLLFVLGGVSALIAHNRISSVDNQEGILFIIGFDILQKIIEELGFNFYSIAFVSSYVPSMYDYQFGLSYINSFISLIPSTFDILGIKNNIINPTQWLIVANHDKFGSLLDFGTGFSFIAETYLNFSWLGCIISFFIPYILKNIFSHLTDSNNWERYVRLVTLYILITFPRRAMVESLITFEYAILFLGLYLIVSDMVAKKLFTID